MSQEGTIETIVTKNLVKDGNNIFQKMSIVETFSKMPMKLKIVLGMYSLCVSSGFFIQTYYDGRDNLISDRKKRADKFSTNPTQVKKNDYEADWKATKEGCKSRPFLNFIDSLIFPYSWATNLIPKIVLYFNQDTE